MKNIFRTLPVVSLLIAITIPYTNFYPQTEDLIFKNISTADGLPSNIIRTMFQDHLGFLWFGTGNGLVKYDGYELEIFQHDDNNTNSLSNNFIAQIDEDKNGNLWILTKNTGVINKFERETRKFIRFLPNSVDSTSPIGKGFSQFCLDSSGDIWALSYTDKLYKLNTKTGVIKQYFQIRNNNTDFGSNRVYTIWLAYNILHSALFEDSKGTMWIGTRGGGLKRYDRESDSFFSFKHDPENSNSISCDTVSSIFEDSQGNLWVCTIGGGLNHYSPEKGTFISYQFKANDPNSISNDDCYKIFEDKSNNLWISHDNGLDVFDRKRKVFTNIYRHVPKDPNSLDQPNRFGAIYEDEKGFVWILIQNSPNQIDRYNPQKGIFLSYWEDYNNPKTIIGHRFYSFLKDHSGSFWMGTEGRGVTKFDPLIQNFRNYKLEPGDINSLSHNVVLSTLESKAQPGVIWIGTPGGLNKFDQLTNSFTHYNHDPNNSNSLSNDYVGALVEDETGLLWISTKEGLNSYNTQSGQFRSYDPSPEYSKNWEFTLYQDHSGIIWLVETNRGLTRFDKKNKTFTRYYPYPQEKNRYTHLNNIVCVYEDREGSFWIGKREGLRKFDRQQETFTSSLLQLSIKDIFEDSNNNLWLATDGYGLALFDRKSRVATFYNQDQGLVNSIVESIIEDEYGNLWLATSGGLSRFNLQTKVFTNFYTQHGLPSLKFEGNTGIKTSNGNIWLGTIDNGIVTFNPADIKINTIPPKIVFTDIRLFGKSLTIASDSPLKQNISVAKEVQFEHWQNDISFVCSALHFDQPQHNQYAFWLENYDDDWRYTEVNRVAAYTNLDPGEYILHAKGANSYFVWNEEGVSIAVIILPPWWATTWAYFIYALIIICIIYFTWKLQLKRVRIKHDYEMSKFETEKLHEVDEMKSIFFANISHEFRTPLTLILGPVKQIIERVKDKQTKEELKVVHKNADRLHGLVNQLLDLSKLEAGRMTLETCPENIIPLLKGLVLSFASLAERKNITLKFNASEEEIIAYIDIEKVEKIVINILSNAFKFTGEGKKIDVNVQVKDRNVEIGISDEGVGISSERLDKIFDRFYQVDGSHTREQEGTGIGLALTKELVELHKGEITVVSEEGKGTTFTVLLPLGKEHLKPDEICDEKKETREEKIIDSFDKLVPEEKRKEDKLDIKLITETEKPLLLIVEDNNDVRNYIKGHVEKDYRIMEAVNGEDGVNKALEHIPDLIVSDVMMPKMDGFELCGKLKTDERTSHIPVILLTAKATGNDKIEGLESGADDYIMKPFDAKELQVRVKNLIDQRIKIIEHYRKKQLFDISDMQVASRDKKFLNRALEVIEKHISDENFNVDSFASEIALSRVQLHRKLVALIGHPPGDFIRIVRLTKGAKLIKNKFGNISEIALEVGFSNPSNFAKAFRIHFGVPPSEYKKESTD